MIWYLLKKIILKTINLKSKGENEMENLNIKGIDISNYQSNINLNEVKAAGYKIVYIKATEGQTYIDPLCEINYNKAIAAGLNVGFYHFMHSTDDGAVQAEFFYNKIKGKNITCRPAIDIEVTDNQDNEAINKCILDFSNKIKELMGLDCVIYTYLNFANTYLDSTIGNIPLWLAEYGVSTPQPTTIWGSNLIGWQFNDNGNFTGSTDLDLFSSDIFVPVKENIELKSNDIVTINQSATEYATGQTIPDWVKSSQYTIEQISINKVLLQEIESWVNICDVTLVPFVVGAKVKISQDAKCYATGQAIPSWVKQNDYIIQQVNDNECLLQEIQSWITKSNLILL